MDMILKKITHRVLTRGASKTSRVKADSIVGVSDLLFGPEAGAIRLPVLPQRLKGEAADDIEFAAAPVNDRLVLAALVSRYKPVRLFEIGTFRGVTSLVMALNAPEGATLFTLDLPPDLSTDEVAGTFYSDSPNSGFHTMVASGTQRQVGLALRYYQGSSQIKQLFGDSAKMDFSPYWDSIDLFFIDGCHEYKMALTDTRAAWRCVKPGGVLVWHDYHWPSVQAAVAEAALGVPVTYVDGTSVAYTQRPA